MYVLHVCKVIIYFVQQCNVYYNVYYNSTGCQRSRKTGSAVLSRVSLIILHAQAESDAYYTRHRVSPEFIRSHNCVPMVFTTESPPAQGQ